MAQARNPHRAADENETIVLDLREEGRLSEAPWRLI